MNNEDRLQAKPWLLLMPRDADRIWL